MTRADRNSKPASVIIVCGSMAFYDEMLLVRQRLSDAGVPSLIPVREDHVRPRLTKEQFDDFKRGVSLDHLRRIRDPRTFGILAVNLQKHGVANYVGPNTFAEIAFAFAHKKRIYLLSDIAGGYRDELEAWKATALHGKLDRLVDDFHRFLQGNPEVAARRQDPAGGFEPRTRTAGEQATLFK